VGQAQYEAYIITTHSPCPHEDIGHGATNLTKHTSNLGPPSIGFYYWSKQHTHQKLVVVCLMFCIPPFYMVYINRY
jgi:hypothetical protein